jgi:cytochrome c
MISARILAAAFIASAAAPALAAGDVEAGKNVFKKCAVCHTAEAGKNKIGPSLFGIVDRKSATVDGFNYSPAMKGANKVWSAAELDTYLTAPQKVVPGSRMVFVGLPNAKEREDIIAYLSTLK